MPELPDITVYLERLEHVARVVDVGTLESGAPYMVTEHLSGSDCLTDRGIDSDFGKNWDAR